MKKFNVRVSTGTVVCERSRYQGSIYSTVDTVYTVHYTVNRICMCARVHVCTTQQYSNVLKNLGKYFNTFAFMLYMLLCCTTGYTGSVF